MVQGATYALPFRRRREGKTDYRKRRALIASQKPRLVVRPSNKNLTIQLVEARSGGDAVLASATSKDLYRLLGWNGDPNNTPAAYLVGFTAAVRAIRKGIAEAVLDIGLRSRNKGSRVAAALKGALDAGLKVPHDESYLPSPERIRGEHIAEYAKALAKDPASYSRSFSQYLSRGLRPEDLPEHFEAVKAKLVELTQRGEAI